MLPKIPTEGAETQHSQIEKQHVPRERQQVSCVPDTHEKEIIMLSRSPLNVDVLVVEDCNDDAELTMRALSKTAQHLCCLRMVDGEQAVDFVLCAQLYKTRPRVLPKLILLDVEMPGMSGLQVLRELRASYSSAELPVVMFSSSDNELVISECLESGATAYAVKPMTLDAYTAKVRDLASTWVTFRRSA
ncbi:MAG: response regulator [Steroidobacteraceae bacterium]